jgi:hypothetical protein
MTTVKVSKTKEESLFYIPINYFEVVGVDNKALADEVLSSRHRITDNKDYSGYEDAKFDADKPQGLALVKTIEALALNSGLEINSMWSHIHEPKESTNTHNHLNSDMAFVYYVATPEGSGNLLFELENKLYTSVPPLENNLLIFPAWVKHRVTKNTGTGIRISISGNLIIKETK